MAEVSGKLRRTTKLDGNYVWNGSRIIEGLVVYLELQISDWLGSLDLKNVQTENMTRDKEDVIT